MSLKQLIHNCKKQDIKAQEQLYRLYANKLFAVCLKYSSNYQQAEDNLQDGFMTIFEKIKQYQDKGSFEGWMKRIMINTTLQKYRKQTVFEIFSEENLKEPALEIDEDTVPMDYLLEIIQELPDRYRQVFNLYALDGFSHKEIAEMLQITTGTSKSNLARARMILKERIEANQVTKAVSSL
ncbi:RNA polymerase sigma factor [Antarcticibacterium flavum]|uniref:RNA polymerase sigma factor n=1 Tax=Antarcticibacterium flavum TaxID=2058175 RepID=A0A5B7X495_9FLAO|nr:MULTISPECIES: RNA polymerase sigma factor [Antarcticibacterium]MCM4159164.1 RNA polymerase subunit sigma-70 [Antarcticibacterium sp. W02-3]QCY69562.1 RNA polymerase sigma factor [Antarcticibacterium flavum]